MKMNRVLARSLVGAAAIMLAACGETTTDAGAEDEAVELDPQEASRMEVVREFATLSGGDLAPSEIFGELTYQIFTQTAANPGIPQQNMARWTDETTVRGEIERRFAPHADAIENALLTGIRDSLSGEQVDTLGAMRDTPEKLDIARCAANSVTTDWAAKWLSCESARSVTLSDAERQAYEAFVGALTSTISNDTILSYWGGTTCRLLTDFATDVSRDGFELEFNDLNLHLGDSDNVACPVLEDRLAELVAADAG